METGSAYDPAQAVATSKQTLEKMAAIGFIDHMDGFAAKLTQLRGRPVNIGHANQGRTRRKDPMTFTPEQIRKIEAICAPDTEIYQWARARYGAATPGAAS